MKTSVTVYSFRDPIKAGQMDIRSFIATAAEMGFHGVDLGYYWKNEDEKAEARDWARESGIEIACIITDNDFAHEDPARRRAELDKIFRACDDARTLNAELVRVFGGSPKPGVTFDKARKNILEGLARGAEYAEELGVILALENHGALCGRVAQVKYFIEAIDSPSLRANIDLGNFLAEEEDPVRAAETLARFAALVHVKDMEVSVEAGERKVRGCIVGRGRVDHAACFEVLADENYDGWISIEYEGPEPPAEGVPQSLAHVNRVLADL